MMNLIRRKKASRGWTVLELIVVLAIILAAAAAIVNRVQAARQSTAVQAEGANLSAIVSKAQSSFAGRPNYSGISTAMLLAQNTFPAQMVVGTNVSHYWNGAVTVAAGTGNTTFDITYAAVPTAACIELVSNVSRTYNEITVGTTAVKAGATIANLATLQTACAATAAPNIVFNAS